MQMPDQSRAALSVDGSGTTIRAMGPRLAPRAVVAPLPSVVKFAKRSPIRPSKQRAVFSAGRLEANNLAGSEATLASIEFTASKIRFGRHAASHQGSGDPTIQAAGAGTGSAPAIGEGTADLHEAVFHGSVCRRDFFPWAHSIEASPTWPSVPSHWTESSRR